MNKEQFDHASYTRWKSNEFTKLFIQRIVDHKDAATDTLIHSHMNDLTLLGKYLGRIQALTDLLETTYADLTNKE